MQVRHTYTTVEANRMMNAFVLFHEEGMKAVLATYPEYKDFVDEHKECSVRQVRNLLYPPKRDDVR
jgi:hypothetical protein